MRRSYSDKIFHMVNTAVIALCLVLFLWPLWFVVIASISDPDLVNAGKVLLVPQGINFDGYKKMLEYTQIWVGYANSIFYTAVGTLCSMIFSICMAYPMSEKSFAPRKIFMIIFMISMYFGGGVIPTYLLLRSLHIVNTRLAMIIPGMISVYNCLIIRSYFMNSIPGELKEAATLDGANAAQYLVKVVMPLSKSVFAVVGLYYAVGYWNNYTKALYYIYKDELMPLQMILRNLLIDSKMLNDLVSDPEYLEEALAQSQLMKYGVIIVAAIPMFIIYPFVQKHFVKGVMVGAVKG